MKKINHLCLIKPGAFGKKTLKIGISLFIKNGQNILMNRKRIIIKINIETISKLEVSIRKFKKNINAVIIKKLF